MPAPHVLVTRPIPQAALDLLARDCVLEVAPEDPPLGRRDLVRRLAGKAGALTLLTETFDAEVLCQARDLRVVANMAVGYDNIDVEAATERGILVTNTPGVLTDTTADLAMSLLLAVARRLVEADAYARQGRFARWGPLLLLGQDVHGKTLGVLGMGRIGTAVARRGALGFGMEVLYHSHRSKPDVEAELGARFVSLPELLGRSDFLSLHLPLTDATRHLLGEEELRLMKPTAVLVNTARGPIVDEAALARVLRQGHLAGAGLDVFEDEPTIHPELLDLPNAILLPHVGSGTVETRTRMATLAARNLLAALKGQRPPCLVNPRALEGS